MKKCGKSFLLKRQRNFQTRYLSRSYFGENIGTEMDGKGDSFTRPVLILKKYDRFSFLAVPLTSKAKKGTWYFTFTHNDKEQTVVLSQGRVINYKRLKE